jgi:hypothetical protein
MKQRDQILKVWDEVIAKVARNVADPTDEEIAAVSDKVCGTLAGVTPDDITAALRYGVEEERRNVATAERVLQILKGMLAERSGGPLPGLPGGQSLKH